jgi:hypothetical protein
MRAIIAASRADISAATAARSLSFPAIARTFISVLIETPVACVKLQAGENNNLQQGNFNVQVYPVKVGFGTTTRRLVL